MSCETLDARIKHLVRAVRNEIDLFDRKIIGLREELARADRLFPTPIDSTGPNYTGQPIGRPHLGASGLTPKEQYTWKTRQAIDEIQAEIDENEQALISLDKGLLPSGGSRRWMAREGYADLYSDAVRLGLVAFGNTLGKQYYEVVDEGEVIKV
jgi:hypothetical protein